MKPLDRIGSLLGTTTRNRERAMILFSVGWGTPHQWQRDGRFPDAVARLVEFMEAIPPAKWPAEMRRRRVAALAVGRDGPEPATAPGPIGKPSRGRTSPRRARQADDHRP